MMTFDTATYGPAVAAILGDEFRPMPLGPGTPENEYRAKIAACDLPAAAKAGLYLYRHLFDESHAISQDLHTPLGSLWHAVLHRREPDAWNSKYWFRQAGHHAVFDELKRAGPSLGFAYSTPAAFIDFVERVRGTGTPGEQIAEAVQLLEWQLLFAASLKSSN
jgi:hypothetical protein